MVFSGRIDGTRPRSARDVVDFSGDLQKTPTVNQLLILESIATAENNLSGDFPQRFHAFSRDGRGIGIELSQRRTDLETNSLSAFVQ
jgi:hypothetical protein